MFLNSHRRGFPIGSGNFRGYGRGQQMQFYKSISKDITYLIENPAIHSGDSDKPFPFGKNVIAKGTLLMLVGIGMEMFIYVYPNLLAKANL